VQKQDWHVATSPEHIDELAPALAAKAGQKAIRPPITANPAFPWIVALWFAALLGVGSLILPVALLERASTATGLASVLPMAAPPLGFTAQSLVALVGTLAGGMFGFLLARKIAATTAGTTGKDNSRKVLSAPEDIGEFGIDGDDHDDLPAPPSTGRRRALAIEPEDGPSDFLKVAPLPAVREPRKAPVDAEVEEPVAEEPATGEPGCEADSASVDEPRQEFQRDPVGVEDEVVEDELLELDASAELAASVDAEFTEQQPAQAHELAEPGFERQEFIAVANAGGPVVDVNYTQPVEAAATASEPLPFSPPSMAREGMVDDDGEDHGEQHVAAEPTFAPEHDAGPESEDMVSDKQIFQAPDAPAVAAPEVPVEDMASGDTGEEQAEEGGEGLVQLVQRLGATLEKHREWSAEQAVRQAMKAPVADAAQADVAQDAADEAPVPDEFDPAAAEDAAQAMAAFFGSPAATPAAETETEDSPSEGEATPAPAFDERAARGEEPRQRYGAFSGMIAAAQLDVEDEDEDEDEITGLAASFSLPRMQKSEPEPMPRPAFDQPPPAPEVAAVAEQDEEEPEESAAVADFGSLNPFKRNAEEFVRIEEPEPDADNAEPAVLFPNQEARKAPAAPAPVSRAFDPPAGEAEVAPQRAERPRPSNDDNERALREALLNLQRMGK
jgi:hypothetical protein